MLKHIISVLMLIFISMAAANAKSTAAYIIAIIFVAFWGFSIIAYMVVKDEETKIMGNEIKKLKGALEEKQARVGRDVMETILKHSTGIIRIDEK